MSSSREGSSGLTENRDWRYQERDDPQITQMTQKGTRYERTKLMGSSRPSPLGQSFESAASVENVRDPQTYAIIGAAMEVHRILGCGFLEAVYQEALTKEFLLRGIPFRREIELPISYKGSLLAVKYKPDFICYDTIIVELKALDRLGGREKAQVINYLKATGMERGLLLNFGTTRLEYERLILTARYSSADYTDNTDQKEQRKKKGEDQNCE